MKQFAFVSDAAEREYKALPKEVQREFGTSLRAVIIPTSLLSES